MVVWAEVKDIGARWIGDSAEVVKSVDQFIEQGFVPIEINVGIKDGGEAADLYQCSIYPLNGFTRLSTGNGRGRYFVEEITFESIDATLAEIEKSINKLWGNDWNDVSSRVSWFAYGEWEFMYEKDEPVLNPDGTINYDPEAYMYHEDLTYEEYFEKYSPDTPPEIVQAWKEQVRRQGAEEAARKAAHNEHLN